jgi:hypothetical protein
VVVISCFLIVALFYFIKILRNFFRISEILKNYAENTESELKEIADHIKQSRLFTFFFGKEKKKEENKSHKKSV